MIVAEQARARLEALGLTQAAAVLDGRLEAASHKSCSYGEFLADLLEAEVKARRERYLKARTRLAHFPFHKTLEAFDFAFQPSVDERLLRELAGLAFIRETANIVLLGPPGTGKTHLAVALGMQAVANGFGAYFTTAYAVVEDLRRAYEEHRLERRMRVYLAPRVLIIDEVGYLPLDPAGATAFFQLVSARYEKGSIVLTSNKGFGDWGEVFGDQIIATAILDRLLHHSHVINIRGDSYRLREKRRSGLFGGPHGQQGSDR